MAKRFPIAPAHPERNCWGCDLYCSANDMRCGNGSDRTQHPVELFGPDWLGFEPPTTETVARAPDGDAVAEPMRSPA